MPRSAALTADELLHLNLPNKRAELVRGTLVVHEPPGYIHGYVGFKLARLIGNHVEAQQLGHVLAAESGFKLFSNPDTVRAPDVAFIRRERIPDPQPSGYPAMAPDLAVEILSPSDTQPEAREKVDDWLGAGTALVWVIDPRKRMARIYRADGTDATIGSNGTLNGESVLPGFTCELASIF